MSQKEMSQVRIIVIIFWISIVAYILLKAIDYITIIEYDIVNKAVVVEESTAGVSYV